MLTIPQMWASDKCMLTPENSMQGPGDTLMNRTDKYLPYTANTGVAAENDM